MMSPWLSFVLAALLMWSSAYGVWQLVRPRERARTQDRDAPRPSASRYRWFQSRWAGAAWLVLGLLGLTAASNSVGWQTEGAAFWSDGGVPALEARLRSDIVGWARQHRPVGVAVGIVADDGVARATLGRSRLLPGGPPLREALFEIGSITKTFTGILLAHMVEEGVVHLDRRVADSLPPGIELPVEVGAITLEQLATHTAGLPRQPPGMLSVGGFVRAVVGMDPYRGYTADELSGALDSTSLTGARGERSVYSNFGFALLGWILGREAGVGYRRAIRDLVLAPLDVDGIEAEAGETAARRAAGYRVAAGIGPLRFGLRAQSWEMTEAFGGAGGLRSTLDGMLGYLAANMKRRATPLAAAVELSQQERFRTSPDRGMGLGWVRSRREDIGQTVIWHNGGTFGFSSFLGFTADGRFGVVALSNTSVRVDDLALRLLAMITDDGA